MASSKPGSTEPDCKDDVPPPYYPKTFATVVDDEEMKAAEDEAGEAAVSIKESVPKENVKKPAGPYVLLCPHELLSFPRLQAVVKFPKFKKNEKWIPALTTDVSPYHKCQNSEPCQCYFENDGYAWGYGDIKFWYPGYFDDHPGPHSGVLLESLWVFWLNRFSTALVTVDDVKGFFSHFPVWLCPHKLLIDWVTPERVLTALQNVREKSAYPLETHRREESLANQEKCKKCHTMYICWLDIYKEMLCVKSIRLLGRAKSAKDPIWLSQCVGSKVVKSPLDGFQSFEGALSTVLKSIEKIDRKILG